MDSTRKSRIDFPLVLVKVSHLTEVIQWKKTGFTRVIAANERAKLPQLQNLHLDLLTITFLAIYKDIHRMEMNNTFLQIIRWFEGKVVLTVIELEFVYQTCSLVFAFKSVQALIFLTRSLIERCQIVTETCKNNVLKFVWKPFKSPLSLRK